MEKTIECTRCGLCVRECGQLARAITPTSTGVRLDLDRCIACGHCAAVCPTGAMDNPRAPSGPLAGEPPAPADMARYLRLARSVRCYKDTLVPHQQMMQLLDIGRYPQTAVNSQGISYLVLEGRERMEELTRLYCGIVLDAGFSDPLRPTLPAMAQEYLDTGRDFLFRGAPQLILALADADSPRGRDNARFSLTFIALLAPSMGIGTCWAGFFEALAMDPAHEQPFCDFLQLPPGKRICGALMAGVPDMTYIHLAERQPLQVEWR